jgi:class 3 adenylate cyclase/tetratricopeptide (TPR) repeat protein
MVRPYNPLVLLPCPSCGAQNVEGARFCSSCGAALPAGKAPARRERKFATALFADLVGSTALAEREDPEVVQSLVGRAFDRLAQEVQRYGGVVEKFMGDAVLAVFGVPTSHEDDPERAVRCGLEMQAVLSELNRGFAAEGKPTLAMRIGIEAGEVLVDLERVSGPRDRMLTGDAVNTAARLQSATDPGSVLVGAAAWASTKEVIDYREAPPLELKGKAAPVAAWVALRVRARRRGERAPLGLEARLIGRDEELSVLKQTLHRVESEGRPGLVTMLGPAGVGKSRLAWELLKYVEGLPTTFYWRRGRCLAYGNLSYSALAEAIKAQCEVLEDDPVDVVRKKVERAVDELLGDQQIAQHMLALVGSGNDRAFTREELFDAWRRFLERLASRFPLVLVLEDIHWADAGLLDFIDHISDWAQGPILTLAMARPELLDLRPTWGGGKRNYSAIYLDPLSREENEAMLDDLLTTSLPTDLKRLVVERSEGNPLFTEEIVRMFIDRGVLRATDAARWEMAASVSEVDVPRSIQGLIAARLDALPREEKASLQDAAVIGRIFWSGAVGRLAGWPMPQTREILGRLRVKEIVVPREPPAFSDELEFAFRHVLIRDVAYESLPKSLRGNKHEEVARWAEERSGDRSEEIAELLATHYMEALRFARELGESERMGALAPEAYRWSRIAGDRAMRLWQMKEATAHYRDAVSLVEEVDEDPRAVAGLWDAYAEAGLGTAPYEQVRGALMEALRSYEDLGATSDAAEVRVNLARVAWDGGHTEEARSWLDQAVNDLEPLGHTTALARALAAAGNFYWRLGQDDRAQPILERAIEVAEATGFRSMQGQALMSLGMSLTITGRWEEGLAMAEQSFAIAKEIGDLDLLLRCYNNIPRSLSDYAPDYARAQAMLLEGLELARRSGRRDMEAWLLTNLALTARDLGDLEAFERYARSKEIVARDLGFAQMLAGALREQGMARLERGDIKEAERLEQEGDAVWSTWEPQAIPFFALARARRLELAGRTDEALDCLLQGIADSSEHLDAHEGEGLLFEAIRMLLIGGRIDEATEKLELIRRVATGRVHAEANADWAEALIEHDLDRRIAFLRRAVDVFDRLGRRIDLGRCLLDLARAERELRLDPRPSAERARDLFVECTATLRAADAEQFLAELPNS